MTDERWAPIPGWEGLYEVSDLGRVRSLDRDFVRSNGIRMRLQGKVFEQSINNNGRPRVTLRKPGVSRYRLVQQLVAEAFLGPRPDGMECCHWDGDPLNNKLSNLRWDTPSANSYDTVRHGKNHLANLTHCKHGHEFTPENTRTNSAGHRACIQCSRRRAREQWEQRRDAMKVAS